MLRYVQNFITRRIDKNIMDHDIDKVFKYFDTDGGGDLSFDEFSSVL